MIKSIEHAIWLLGDHRSRKRKRASKYLIKRGEEAIPDLIEALDSDNGRIVSEAIFILGEIRAKQVTMPSVGLVEEAQDAGTQVHDRIVNKDATPVLLGLLTNADVRARAAAAEALGMFGSPEAVPSLVRATYDPEIDVRRSAAGALMMFGEKAIPELAKLLDETDKRICHRARKELQRIGTEEALAAVEEWERRG